MFSKRSKILLILLTLFFCFLFKLPIFHENEDKRIESRISTSFDIYSSLYLWNRTWGEDPTYESSFCGAVDDLNNIYMAGHTDSLASAVILCYNSSGNELWRTILPGYGIARDIAFDSLNNIFIVSDSGYERMNLIKLNISGCLQWSISRDSIFWDLGTSIAVDSNNDIYIGGWTKSGIAEPTDFLILKYNSTGELIWSESWGGLNGDSCFDISIDSEDNLYYAGYTNLDGETDSVLLKLNSTGDVIWSETWGGVETECSKEIYIDNNDNIYVAGEINSLGDLALDFFLLKYNKYGELQWDSIWNRLYDQECYGITIDSYNNIYLVGMDRFNWPFRDNLIVKFDEFGNFLWSSTWTHHQYDSNDYLTGVGIDSNDYLYLMGRYSPDYSSNIDMILYKFNRPRPYFEIINPISNDLFGKSPPYFELEYLESNVDSSWYVINGGEKTFFSGNSGVINLEIWDACPNGTNSITFFANNSDGYIDSNQVIIQKDSIAPTMDISLISENQLYGNQSPVFEIICNDSNLNSVWYSIDDGINNYSILDHWNKIDQHAWNSCINGSVNVFFYANDTLGNTAFHSIHIFKDLTAPYIEIKKPEILKHYSCNLFYEVIKHGNNIDQTWYTVNNGTKSFFNASSGFINSLIWNNVDDGEVLLTFLVNDTASRQTKSCVKIIRDTICPNINILEPYPDVFFSHSPPNYNIDVFDIHLNSTWYTIDNGKTNYTIINNIGELNFDAWSSCPDGNIFLQFHANDSAGNLNQEIVTIYKDTIKPNITINSPILNKRYLCQVPQYNLSIMDCNLNQKWYTINDGFANYFVSDIDEINATEWNGCDDGYVNITFYASDFSGNLAYDYVIVRKNVKTREAYAIIIGISDYPGSSFDLNYCDDDAAAVYNMLISDYNFRPENIIYLQDSSASKSDIDNAFNTIISSLESDDIFFFYYSGHGGRGTYTTQSSWNVETLHPYWNDEDHIWSSPSVPGALYMRIHFERFQTEDYYDFALGGSVSVAQGYYFEEFTGNLGYNFWSSYIPVSQYYLRFISDSSITDWGFKVDKYEALFEDGTHYLCSYDSIPNNPNAYYLDSLIDSKLDQINCEEKYIFIDACNSGGLIPEVHDVGRYIMTACHSSEESLETPLLEHGIFTNFLLEAEQNASDQNDDGLISMEECYDYVYSNTVSYSNSFGSEYTHHPQEYDGIPGESILKPSIGSVDIINIENSLDYSFKLYGHGNIISLNLTYCSIQPSINLYTEEIKYQNNDSSGFGTYSGTIQIEEGVSLGGIRLVAIIEGYQDVIIDIFYGDSDGDSLNDIYEILNGIDPISNDTDSDGLNDYEEFYGDTDPTNNDTDNDGLSDGQEILSYLTNPLMNDTDSDNLNDYDEVMIYMTNPFMNDTDSDNLNDYDEVIIHFSNPLTNDTDSDHLNDYDELMIYFSDPLTNDTDSDNLTDYDEIFVFYTNPLMNDTDSDNLNDYDEIFVFCTNPLDHDTDQDELSDYDELFIYGTNSTNSDTDSDAMPDGWEIDNLLDPFANDTSLDPDNDLLTNIEEFLHNTSAQNNDTDYDLLLDNEELYIHHTNPVNNDSDSDGLIDGFEVYIYNTDPLDRDTDSDGLLDGEEVNTHGTDPLSGDTDSDFMPDKWEVDHLLDPMVNDTMLDPDNDNLTNLEEYQHGTDPQDADTDNDGWDDGTEIERGTDPLDPNDHPSPPIPSASIPGYELMLIYFSIAIMTLISIKQKKKKFSR
ncbi:MAG: hypothetical protein EU535_05945 [Promethearchaeota archaeon]|nr:MAG: hypothetical protein EU535_05945 [Candidatus Lokiarchaeota archaeon]